MSAVPSAFRNSVVAVVCLIALVGCSGRVQQPRNYGDVNAKGEGFYGNLMYGCTGVQPTKGKYINETMSSSKYCRCLYDGMKESVPFEEVKKFEDQQAELKDGEELKVPKRIESVRGDCDKTVDDKS